jgi:hypothetical protein
MPSKSSTNYQKSLSRLYVHMELAEKIIGCSRTLFTYGKEVAGWFMILATCAKDNMDQMTVNPEYWELYHPV